MKNTENLFLDKFNFAQLLRPNMSGSSRFNKKNK